MNLSDNINNNSKGVRKIAMFCHDDPLALIGSQETGGQAVYVNSLIKELDKKGWAIDVYIRLDSPHKKSVSIMGKRSRLIRLKGGPAKYISRKLLFDFLPEIYENFLNCIDHNNPYEFFHGHYWDGGWLAMKAHRQFSKPFIENFHSLGKIRLQTKQQYTTNGNEKDVFEKRFLLEEEIVKEAALIISLSESEKKYLIEKYNAPSEKITVIPGGVDLKIFSSVPQMDARKKIDFSEDSFILLSVGRLEWRKGIGTLIFATDLLKNEIPKIKVIIIGGKIHGRQKNVDDFKEYQRLVKIAKEKNIENLIYFMGCIDHNRLPLFYSASNVFVIPSYYEPFGLVTLEGMACKVPVVASNVGGLATTIKNNENGLLFKPRNPLDLREKIIQLYKNPDIGKKIVENAYHYAQEKYSWKAIVKKIIDVYKSFIEDKQKNEDSFNKHQ